MQRAIAIYISWRTAAMDARAVPPVLSGSAAGVGQVVRWHPVLDASIAAEVETWIVRDEWSGAEHTAALAELSAGIPLDTARADGLALSVRPA